MENDNGKFVTREPNVRERILMYKAGIGDYEALVMLVESRLQEPILGLRDMPISDFEPLAEECIKALNEASKITRALMSVMSFGRQK